MHVNNNFIFKNDLHLVSNLVVGDTTGNTVVGNGNVLTVLNGNITLNSNGTSTGHGIIFSDGSFQATAGGGGSAAGGLYSQVMSATPTLTSTGLSNWVNQGSSSAANSLTGVTLTTPNNGGSITGMYAAAPTPPYSVSVLLGITRATGGYGGNGIGWYDGSSKIHDLSNTSSNGGQNFLEVSKWNSYSSFSGDDYNSNTGNTMPVPIWMQLRDDGTNIYFKFSFDGANYLTLYSNAKSSSWLGSSGYNNILLFSTANFAITSYVTAMSWTVTNS